MVNPDAPISCPGKTDGWVLMFERVDPRITSFGWVRGEAREALII